MCSWPLSRNRYSSLCGPVVSFFMSSNHGMFLTIRSCRKTCVLRTILVGHLSFLLSKCPRRTTPKMRFGIIRHLRRQRSDCLRDRIRLQEVQQTKSAQSSQLVPEQLATGSVRLLTEQADNMTRSRRKSRPPAGKPLGTLLETFVQSVRCPFAFWWCRRPGGILLNAWTFWGTRVRVKTRGPLSL